MSALTNSGLLDLFIEMIPALWKGAIVTLELWSMAMLLGTALALPLVWFRIYGGRVSSFVVAGYVEVMRGTPMIVQMFILYFGLPEIGIVFEPFSAAVIAIGLNSAAYQCEYLRGSIGSVPTGQFLAGRAIGLSGFGAFTLIVMPQAVRRVLPQWSNEALIELKFTSIAYAIGVTELTGQAEIVGYSTFRFVESFICAGIVYVAMATFLILMLKLVEISICVPGVTSR